MNPIDSRIFQSLSSVPGQVVNGVTLLYTSFVNTKGLPWQEQLLERGRTDNRTTPQTHKR